MGRQSQRINFQDSDGWSPLHCAASCNNLDLLKMLVENGACVFATTLSTAETAADRCLDSDSYAECAQYMDMVEKCMGILNDGKVKIH